MIGQSSPGLIEEWLAVCLHFLELLGVLAGLILVGLLLARLIISLWRVTFRGQIAVMPFEGSERAAAVGQLLPQRWPFIERRLKELVKEVREQQPKAAEAHPFEFEGDEGREAAGEPSGPRPDDPPPTEQGYSSTSHPARLSATPRSLPPGMLDESQFTRIEADPIERSLSPVTVGGISVSPNIVLDIIRRIEMAVARRTLQGTVHEFVETVRMSASVREPGHPSKPVDVIAEAKTGHQLLDAVDDLAFAVIKERHGIKTLMVRWRAYELALAGYADQLRFEWTAVYEERERAITKYGQSLALDPADPLVNYNFGALLYGRYVEEDTRRAIDHFKKASQTEEPDMRALALAGLAMSYCQMIHRYDDPDGAWRGLAGETSGRALELAPDLKEVTFARGFALQVAERFDEALEFYDRTTTLPGDTQAERRLRSFAKNNAGWIKMETKHDLDGAKADFERALELWRFNKMSYANLGDLRRRANDLDGALDFYTKALELDPQYINGANEKGMLYLDKARRDLDRSDEFLREALKWHKRALSLITGDSANQEASLRARFAQRAAKAGFVGYPGETAPVGGQPSTAVSLGKKDPDASNL